MIYDRNEFVPQITNKKIAIKYNKEIMGFIKLQEDMTEEQQAFFSSIEKWKINQFIEGINFDLQKIYCAQKKVINKEYFTFNIEMSKILFLVIFVVYMILFFLSDEMVVKSEKKFEKDLWIAITIIQIVIFIFFMVFVLTSLLVKHKTFDVSLKVGETIDHHIKNKVYEFSSNGYKCEFKKKKSDYEGEMKGSLILKKTF